MNPDTFISHFQSELEKGHEIVGIFLSSRLSGTFQSAVIAKDHLQNDKIHLIDSMSASFGSALLLRHAAKLRDEGKSAEEICQALDSIKHRLAVYGMVDTLKYLHKGGRLARPPRPAIHPRRAVAWWLGRGRGASSCLTRVPKALWYQRALHGCR